MLDKTTYFMFVGVNDRGSTECNGLESIVEMIFNTLHQLYVRARDFVYIDVTHRSSQVVDPEIAKEIEDRMKTWNELLQALATEFRLTSKEVTVLYSSRQLLTDVLGDV